MQEQVLFGKIFIPFPKRKCLKYMIYCVKKGKREKKNILHYICSALVDFVTEPTLDIEVFNQSGYEF